MDIKKAGLQLAKKSLLTGKKFSPEILTGAGIAGVIASTILIARATLKLELVVEHHEEGMDLVRSKTEHAEITRNKDAYPKSEKNKDLVHLYSHTAKDLVILYGPSASLFLASLVSIGAAHSILKRRNVALVAAYKALELGYSEYRKRVVEEYGEDKDRDFRSGIRTEKVTDAETGKSKTVKTLTDPSNVSIYARFFDEVNSPNNWQRVAEYNMMFLKAQEQYANNLLHARGWVLLNEVYKALGIQESSAGALVGWVLNKDGDNHVDFGIYDFANEQARSFVNGQESIILLDFNVDGVVFDLIDRM